MLSLQHTRRDFLRSSVGLAGLTLPTFFRAQAVSARKPRRKAKSCIIIYTWGGMSHYESFDPKPEAPVDIRSRREDHESGSLLGLHARDLCLGVSNKAVIEGA